MEFLKKIVHPIARFFLDATSKEQTINLNISLTDVGDAVESIVDAIRDSLNDYDYEDLPGEDESDISGGDREFAEYITARAETRGLLSDLIADIVIEEIQKHKRPGGILDSRIGEFVNPANEEIK